MIPGWLISIATFPGIIVHEFGHQLFCKIFGVQVHRVCYFRFGNPAGYVVHEIPDSVYHHIWIGIGPFIVNSVIGALIALPATAPSLQLHYGKKLDYILIWLGVSIAMHSFPSIGDAKGIWNALWSRKAPILARLVGTPIVVIIYLGALGSVFWLDLVYGIGVALLIPKAVVAILA